MSIVIVWTAEAAYQLILVCIVSYSGELILVSKLKGSVPTEIYIFYRKLYIVI